jgi:sugar (pentulose or hexulose) kinase
LTQSRGFRSLSLQDAMMIDPVSSRGFAVVDVGATNAKVALFDRDGTLRAERKAPSRHVEGPPYRHIDPEAMAALCRAALPELDAMLPIDTVVPCAHGAALACIAADGSLALPVMDYTAEPPPAIVDAYRKIEPPFAEVFGPLLPMALTHGLQLYWQEQAFPEAFGRISAVMPWIQYVGFRLGGRPVTEISSMSCQSQLMDIRRNTFSSLVRARRWDRLFPEMVPAWQERGTLAPEFRGSGFRGRARILAGLHDSTANYMRYRAAGLGDFTLLSTGTWIIGFDTMTPVDALEAARDTVTNTDIFGTPVACCRFFGGREFEIVAGGAPADAASHEIAARLIARETYALPSFTDSGGPMPGTGGRGRYDGRPPEDPAERASLAALYCALMVSEQLDAVQSKNQVIVDGPFATNALFMGALAAFRQGQTVLASDLRDGTTAGAAVIGMMRGGELPRIGLSLATAQPAVIPGLAAYRRNWREKSRNA